MKKNKTVKKSVKPAKSTKKPAPAVLSPQEKTFNKLIGAWYETTVSKIDAPVNKGGIDLNEALERINTIFKVTCEEFGISAHHAENILHHYSESYAEMIGADEEDYVCPECMAEEAAEAESMKQDNKLLN